MSFGGHTLDMIHRMKQNRAQRPSNRAKFKENNRPLIYSKNSKPNPLQFKTISDKELKTIKSQIRKRAKVAQKKERIFYGISISCILAIIVWILIWMQ